MKTYNENTTLLKFDSWSGAKGTQSRIIEEGKHEEFDFLIEDLYPDGISETQLNDILWFEEEWLFKQLRIKEE